MHKASVVVKQKNCFGLSPFCYKLLPEPDLGMVGVIAQGPPPTKEK